jgi:uncharacterized MAPEG superfamily protein
MPNEYIYLTILTSLFMLAWVPVSLGKMQAFGSSWLLSNRKPVQGKELAPWAARCDRAYANLKDYFPAYAVAIILLGTLNKFDYSTQLAALIFVIARIGHYVSYGLGNVPMRAIFFMVAMASNAYLLIKVLI